MSEPHTGPSPEFERLLSEVIDRAYGTAYHLTRSSHDAEDLVQEAALLAYRNFHQFQAGTNFRAWFMRILTNAYFGSLRTKKRRPQTTTIEDVAPLYMMDAAERTGWSTQHEDPAGAVLDRMGADRVSAAIEALPDEFRVVCALYFMHDAPYQEIADVLDCPVGTVRSRLHRGRRLLQKMLWESAVEAGVVQEWKKEPR
jgi:RNA polymerase sigma-70 factor (ECF subfamily)